MTELEGFLNFARDRLAETDEPLPCEPEDCAAVLGYLAALVPEYQLARQAEASDSEERRADRRRAVLDGFRRVRIVTSNGNGNGNGAHTGNGNGSGGNSGDRPSQPGPNPTGRRTTTPTPPEAA